MCQTRTGSDSSFANGQNSPDQQDFCALPNRFGEKRRELYNRGQQLGRQSKGEAVMARIAGQNAAYRDVNPLGSWSIGVKP
jgi:hypothetical protein